MKTMRTNTVPFIAPETAEEMTVTVLSPRVPPLLERLRRQRERDAARDETAANMKDRAVWRLDSFFCLLTMRVTFIDCRGMGCWLMRERGVGSSDVRRHHEVGFYGETPFDVVSLRVLLRDMRRFTLAMRQLRRFAIEGGYRDYPDLCEAVVG